MFEKTRIKYDPETGVRKAEVYNPVKETFVKAKDKTFDVAGDAIAFIGEYGWAINLALGGGLLVWLLGANVGIDVTNKTLLEGYKQDGFMARGDGLVFKKKMTFDDWMQYLDHFYNTKGGRRNKNINKYLKEKGFID